MKTIFALTTAILLISFSLSAVADQSVRGYIRQDGTYVAPYMRSSPNTYKFDNYSGQGNSNPYTGQRGYAPHISVVADGIKGATEQEVTRRVEEMRKEASQ